jgi:hypothetical protein
MNPARQIGLRRVEEPRLGRVFPLAGGMEWEFVAVLVRLR